MDQSENEEIIEQRMDCEMLTFVFLPLSYTFVHTWLPLFLHVSYHLSLYICTYLSRIFVPSFYLCLYISRPTYLSFYIRT